MRYAFWIVFCACAFFSLTAHIYGFGLDKEAAGAALYGTLLGCAFAFATQRPMRYRLRFRLMSAALYVGLSSALYAGIFSAEIQRGYSRADLVITGAVIAAIPSLIFVVRAQAASAIMSRIA